MDTTQKKLTKLVHMMRRRIIEPQECYYNMILSLITASSEHWPKYLDEMPDDIAKGLHEYANVYLREIDFMPDVSVFLAGDLTPDQIAYEKWRRRDSYKWLYDCVTTRAERQNVGSLRAKGGQAYLVDDNS